MHAVETRYIASLLHLNQGNHLIIQVSGSDKIIRPNSKNSCVNLFIAQQYWISLTTSYNDHFSIRG